MHSLCSDSPTFAGVGWNHQTFALCLRTPIIQFGHRNFLFGWTARFYSIVLFDLHTFFILVTFSCSASSFLSSYVKLFQLLDYDRNENKVHKSNNFCHYHKIISYQQKIYVRSIVNWIRGNTLSVIRLRVRVKCDCDYNWVVLNECRFSVTSPTTTRLAVCICIHSLCLRPQTPGHCSSQNKVIIDCSHLTWQ